MAHKKTLFRRIENLLLFSKSDKNSYADADSTEWNQRGEGDEVGGVITRARAVGCGGGRGKWNDRSPLPRLIPLAAGKMARRHGRGTRIPFRAPRAS